jgi:hypothetical protein
MTTADVIHEASTVLMGLLHRRLREQGLATIRVTAGSPVSIAANPAGSADASLNLFLYLVRVDPFRANPGGVPLRGARGGLVRQTPPLALKLSYLLSAHGPDPLVQQGLLGLGMQVFQSNPMIRPPPLPEDAERSPRPDDMQLVILDLGVDDMNAIWNNTRVARPPSVAVELSPVLLNPLKETEVAPR